MSARLKKSQTAPKSPPQLFHNHRQVALRNLGVAIGASLFAAFAFHVLHNKPRKAKYRDFYSNYDADRSFRRMVAGGYLQSCPPCIFDNEENGDGAGDKQLGK